MIPKPVSIIRPWNKSVHTTVFRPPYKSEQEIKLGNFSLGPQLS